MTMRRFGARWRDATTPAEVLDVFKIEGRFEILIRNSLADGSKEWVDGLDIDEDGYRFPSFELKPYEARGFRLRNGKRRRAWASLPEAVRKNVIHWIETP